MPTAIPAITAALGSVAPTQATGYLPTRPQATDAAAFSSLIDQLEPGRDTTPTPSSGAVTGVGQIVDGLQASQAVAKDLTIKTLTGEVDNVHEATLAATQAQTQLELVANLRNRAIESINEILRTQI